MLTQGKTVIVFPDETQRGLVSRFVIPPSLDEYFNDSSKIYWSGGVVHIPHMTHCQLCVRAFTEASRPQAVLCQSAPVNREFGYVAKICVDCSWYIELVRGNQNIPRSIKKVLSAGHKPRKLDNLIS